MFIRDLDSIEELDSFEPIATKTVQRAKRRKPDVVNNAPIFQFKNAVWQFLLDHALKEADGSYRFFFFVPDEADLWRRVEARRLGKFKRHSEGELRAKAEAYFSKQKQRDREKEKLQRRLEALKTGPLLDRLRYRLIKWLRRALFKLTPQ